MPIIYSLISRGTTVLCDCSLQRGNSDEVAKRIIQKIPQYNSRMSYLYEEYESFFLESLNLDYIQFFYDFK